jgi:hypothetical protein
MCISETNKATGKSVTVADSATCPACAEKIRAAERKFELEQARADDLSAQVKMLTIKLKEAMSAPTPGLEK